MTGDEATHCESDHADFVSGTSSDHFEGRRVSVQRTVVVHGYDYYVGASPGHHGEGWIVGVHYDDRGDAGGDRSPRETVVGDHKVDRPCLPQYIPHGLGVVGVEQAGPVAEGGYRLRPVKGYSSLVEPARLDGQNVAAQLLRPPGEPEVVQDESSRMPGCEDQTPPRPGDGSYPLSLLDEPCGRKRRVDATPSPIRLSVRRVPDLKSNGITSLFEVHVLKQNLHSERVGLVVLEEQAYLAEVVLGTVGCATTRYPGFGEPVCVLSEQRIHGG